MKWSLIENNSHRIFEFSSEKKLRAFAKGKYKIKRSNTDYYGFYVESYLDIRFICKKEK